MRVSGPGQATAFAVSQEPTAAVFVDGTEMGGLDELRQIQANTVDEIRYLSGSEAQTKYGPRFPAGVIEMKLKTY